VIQAWGKDGGGDTKTVQAGSQAWREGKIPEEWTKTTLEDIKIETVTEFTYLRSLLTYDNDCSKEI